MKINANFQEIKWNVSINSIFLITKKKKIGYLWEDLGIVESSCGSVESGCGIVESGCRSVGFI